MTDAEQRAWLRRQDMSRVVLVEMDYMYQVGVGTGAVPTKGTLYFSNKGYIDNDASPAIEYAEAITDDGHPKYARAVDQQTLRGKVSSSVSELKLNNADGSLSALLALAIDGSDVRVYVGDPSWVKTDFVLLFVAMSVKASAALDTISIALKDVDLLVDRNIGGDVAVGGTGPSADKFRPFIFGYVHQLTPPPIDDQNFTYSSIATNASVPVVRSNGLALTGGGTDYTDNGDGTFTMVVPPNASETITCDALRHGAASAVAYRLSDALADIVGTQLGLTAAGKYYGPDATYELLGLNDYHVGDAILDKTNVADWLDKACNTGNIAYGSDRLGRFRFFYMRPEALSDIIGGSGGALGVTRSLTDDDYDVDTLAVDHNQPTFKGYQSYANINQTVISTFDTALSQTQRDMLGRLGLYSAAFFGEEAGTTQYLGSTVSYRGGAPELYNLSLTDSQVVSTMISGPDDTSLIDGTHNVPGYQAAWSSVRRSQALPWTEFLTGTVGLDQYDLELGNIVNETMPFFGLQGGALHQVFSIAIDPMGGIELGVCRRRFANVSGVSRELREDGGFELREDGGKELRE